MLIPVWFFGWPSLGELGFLVVMADVDSSLLYHLCIDINDIKVTKDTNFCVISSSCFNFTKLHVFTIFVISRNKLRDIEVLKLKNKGQLLQPNDV